MKELTYNELATIKEEPYELALHCAYASVIESLEIEEDEVLITIEEKLDTNHRKYAEFTVELGHGMEDKGEMRMDEMEYTVLVESDGNLFINIVDLVTKYVYCF